MTTTEDPSSQDTPSPSAAADDDGGPRADGEISSPPSTTTHQHSSSSSSSSSSVSQAGAAAALLLSSPSSATSAPNPASESPQSTSHSKLEGNRQEAPPEDRPSQTFHSMLAEGITLGMPLPPSAANVNDRAFPSVYSADPAGTPASSTSSVDTAYSQVTSPVSSSSTAAFLLAQPPPGPTHVGKRSTRSRSKSLVRPERRRSISEREGRRSMAKDRERDGVVMTNAGLNEAGDVLRRRIRSNLAPAEATGVYGNSGSLYRSMGRRSNRSDTLNRRNGKMTRHWWVLTSWALTFYLPTVLLQRLGKKDGPMQQAFREKLALCTISFILMAAVAFLTFGFNSVMCRTSEALILRQQGWGQFNVTSFTVRGTVYRIASDNPNIHRDVSTAKLSNFSLTASAVDQKVFLLNGSDISRLFPPVKGHSACDVLPSFPDISCTASQPAGLQIWPIPFSNPLSGPNPGCHPAVDLNKWLNIVGEIRIDWSAVYSSTNMTVYNGHVINLQPLFDSPTLNQTLGADSMDLILSHVGKDSTLAWAKTGKQSVAECLVELFRIGTIDRSNLACTVANGVTWLTFSVISILIVSRFFLALYFSYVIGWRLGNSGDYARASEELKRRRAELAEARKIAGASASAPLNSGDIVLQSLGGRKKTRTADSRFSSIRLSSIASKDSSTSSELANDWYYNFGFMDMEAPPMDPEAARVLNDPTLMHTIVMVPCYSEGEESLKATLTSIARSYYPSTHKCILAVADGLVKGEGNEKTTPEILIDMIEVDDRFRSEDPRFGGEPESYSYVAIAHGTNRKNYAKVYAGWYRYSLESPEGLNGALASNDSSAYSRTMRERTVGRVPMLLIVKVGNDEERNPDAPSLKPGNRGKRDSQVILMNFLSKVMFDDRMTELEFDIFFKLFTITGINPERYESVLMVDADTRIYPDSLTHMVAVLLRDHRVMGICGETRILNKWQSWVTMIQVFEYFVSHHLAKAFESVFGGVSCLPGCFSMYRIKTPKGENGYWVPILANPDIVEEYSENIVDTLHKKNLLLLGEDRFLSTMMLRHFPKRKMVFVPPAVCKTVVPHTFKVLLSQRRRWINSTIHNLMELVLVKDLCGTFCISMQFVIFMELVGTLVLPAAITFTLILCSLAIVSSVGVITVDYTLPLALLAGILLLPGLLVIVTWKKPMNIFWMVIYILSLPIWNFVLPLYAFWHFDDFSWGETRRTTGDVRGEDHSALEGEFDSTGISMKRWREWVKQRREAAFQAEMDRQKRLNLAVARQSTISSVESVRTLFAPGGGGMNILGPPPPQMRVPSVYGGPRRSQLPLQPTPDQASSAHTDLPDTSRTQSQFSQMPSRRGSSPLQLSPLASSSGSPLRYSAMPGSTQNMQNAFRYQQDSMVWQGGASNSPTPPLIDRRLSNASLTASPASSPLSSSLAEIVYTGPLQRVPSLIIPAPPPIGMPAPPPPQVMMLPPSPQPLQMPLMMGLGFPPPPMTVLGGAGAGASPSSSPGNAVGPSAVQLGLPPPPQFVLPPPGVMMGGNPPLQHLGHRSSVTLSTKTNSSGGGGGGSGSSIRQDSFDGPRTLAGPQVQRMGSSGSSGGVNNGASGRGSPLPGGRRVPDWD